MVSSAFSAQTRLFTASQQPPASPMESGIPGGKPTSSFIHSRLLYESGCDLRWSGKRGQRHARFVYPSERFKGKPPFIAATFFASEIQSAKTEKVCCRGR